ncbi:MAG: carboxypeptidase regulatory-like domain-containing protein [Candidatus Acidiferrales bacterium]
MRKFRPAVLLTMALSLAAFSCNKPGAPAPLAAATPLLTLDPAVSGSVSGTVSFDGPIPAPKPIDMSAAPDCQRLHATPADFPDVVTDDHRALANAVVYVKSGLGRYDFPRPATPAILGQKGCLYEPHVVALRVGQSLEISNEDSTVHNIHALPKINSAWNRSEQPNQPPVVVNFEHPELAIPLMCNVHPWMRGYLFVFDHPYFAVTSRSGAFSLANLPPGTYTIEAWQEKFGTLEQSVTVAPHSARTVAFRFHSVP